MAPRSGIICGIFKVGAARKFTVVVYDYSQNNWSFAKYNFDENELINAVGTNKLVLTNGNIEKKNGKYEVVGTTGSLTRFNEDGKNGKTRPVVILSEIRNLSDVVLGYKMVKADGTVSNVKADQMYGYCSRTTKAGEIPIQNAMFIQATESVGAHIRGYKENQFIIERMNIGKRVTKEADVDKKENRKNVSKIAEIFTKEQIRELMLGKEHKVAYKLYGNPNLSAEQMRELRVALENRVNPTRWADPKFSVDAMAAYRIQVKYGVDVSKFIHPNYNKEQIMELSTGLLNGIDISKMGDHTVSAEEMAKRRIIAESELWTEIPVSVLSQISTFKARANSKNRVKSANEKLEEKRKRDVAAQKAARNAAKKAKAK